MVQTLRREETKMPYGFGRGRGFGFRGSSPPWPYVGVGRGGLPRCGYFANSAAWAPGEVPYTLSASQSNIPVPTQFNPESEAQYLQEQAEMLRRRLEQIESRIREIEGERPKNV
jgi:hypothetical protein